MTKYVIIILFDSVNQVELIDTVKGFSSMNENIESSQKFPMRPVAPLGVIAMNGCEEMGRKVNEFLKNWQVDASSDQKLHSFYGSDKDGFLLEAHCPRFGTGEGKGMIKDTVRGYDLFIICDVGAYQCTYKLYGHDVPMTPDEEFVQSPLPPPSAARRIASTSSCRCSMKAVSTAAPPASPWTAP